MTRRGVVALTPRTMLTLRLSGAVLVAGLVGSAQSLAKPPTLTELFPPGAGRGQSVTVNASGTFDHWPVKAWIDGRGVEIRAEKEKGKLTAVVAADAPPSGHPLGPALRRGGRDISPTVRHWHITRGDRGRAE